MRHAMKRVTFGGLALLATGIIACGHTTTVAGPDETKAKSAGDHATPPHDRAAPARHRPTEVAGARDGDRASDGASKDGGLPLTTSPAALLKPGALKTIQERLAKDGGLPSDDVTGAPNAATRDAVARFQRRQDLPATGVPDDATLRKLGLNPDDVFKSDRAPPK